MVWPHHGLDLWMQNLQRQIQDIGHLKDTWQYCAEVVQIIKCTCTVFIDNFRHISTNSSIQVSVCRGSYDGYAKHKRNDPTCDPWDSQGKEKKCSFYFYCFLPWLFYQNWNYNFRGMQNKKPFEIILHVGRVTSLRSWVAKKSRHGQTIINECSISDYPSNFEDL